MTPETPQPRVEAKTYFDGILTAYDTGRTCNDKPIMHYTLTGTTPKSVPPYLEGQRYVVQTGTLKVSTDGSQWQEYAPGATCTIPARTTDVWLAVESGTEATYERLAGVE